MLRTETKANVNLERRAEAAMEGPMRRVAGLGTQCQQEARGMRMNSKGWSIAFLMLGGGNPSCRNWVEGTSPGPRLTDLGPDPGSQLPAEQPTSPLTSLSLRFLLCKMGVTIPHGALVR